MAGEHLPWMWLRCKSFGSSIIASPFLEALKGSITQIKAWLRS